MTKITVEQLMSKMADLDADETEFSEYFILDEEQSGPFSPKFKLNPATVQIPRGANAAQRTAALMNSANWFARMSRRNVFQQKLARGYDGPIIVSEGDSWFQYPIRLRDTIDHLMHSYAIYSLGAAGDLLKRMADKQEYIGALEETGAEILLLSGGGNDLVAGGALASHLEAFDPDLAPADYLLPSFQALLDDALGHYGRMFRQVQQRFPHVCILCHGYDYPVPNKDKWLGKPMESRGIRDRALQMAIAAEMMDQFNRRLRRLARSMPNVTYIDCRGVVGNDRWFDGLHPTGDGYGDVAQKFRREINRIANARSGPPVVISGPFGSATELSRAMQAPPVIAGGPAQGMSLHVGVNTVDPAHYDGWDGQLAACEADALAMQNIAESEGFKPQLLLTRDATRENVVSEVKRAAKDLKPGDMFLFTVSGHGGRVPDFNQDEDHDDESQRMDETLCLYDFQIADDELYMLWTLFRDGVRVLIMPDTCHSGSMARFGPTAPTELFGRALPQDPRIRAMPLYVEDRVWRANEAAYREASKSYSAMKESVMTAPLSSPIQASVLNLGACKDTQFAMDGPENGAFTGALLKVWDNGRFNGDYRAFRAAIDDEIGSDSQTPQLFEPLLKQPNFVLDRPFTLQPVGMAGSTACGSAKSRAAPPPPTLEDADEGEENDLLPDAEVDAILSAKTRGAGFRSATAALEWSDYSDFDGFIRSLGLKNFCTDEFLILGGGHNTPGGKCQGKNTYPPRSLWTNIAKTAQALDHFRDRIGKPIAITNAYRGPAYNACIGGAKASQHMKFCALDFKVSGMPAPEAAKALRWLRDKEGFFTGGIGRYNSFTHIDTRGNNATWPPAFRDMKLSGATPLKKREPRDLAERIAILIATMLAKPRSAPGAKSRSSAFADPVSRSGDDFDPTSENAAHQQSLQAAVNASSVISFVENLTPSQKEDVLLSTLFAQRAADAKADPVKERELWHATYMDMLSLMGWTREAAPFEASQKMKGNGSFDKVILATLAQVATGNQFKIVESAMEALRGLASDDGKIKLFDFETSTSTGGNFQIGSAEASGDVISMALGAFNFNFKDKKQNILFVSWGKNELEYWLSAQKVVLSPTIYADVREIIRDKLSDTRKTLIADIDIG
ncbi:caspase family protein [Aliiroseovarius sp. Z3]|uniref:D-Ala-D-Ala carboxypeptidase family metallohydrolase n=1 Tax=Aliiroseovarius sp. Z3 TaxID=2811402 RepID=UPI0023B2DB47|nr:D-Ala-D-Ala carboxypeptidase family metallohydrolase [Aliiroseovarius sp. Z3]MDE9449800.1 caspase family protein [Aliiroseovarius sp. Z3]